MSLEGNCTGIRAQTMVPQCRYGFNRMSLCALSPRKCEKFVHTGYIMLYFSRFVTRQDRLVPILQCYCSCSVVRIRHHFYESCQLSYSGCLLFLLVSSYSELFILKVCEQNVHTQVRQSITIQIFPRKKSSARQPNLNQFIRKHGKYFVKN